MLFTVFKVTTIVPLEREDYEKVDSITLGILFYGNIKEIISWI